MLAWETYSKSDGLRLLQRHAKISMQNHAASRYGHEQCIDAAMKAWLRHLVQLEHARAVDAAAHIFWQNTWTRCTHRALMHWIDRTKQRDTEMAVDTLTAQRSELAKVRRYMKSWWVLHEHQKVQATLRTAALAHWELHISCGVLSRALRKMRNHATSEQRAHAAARAMQAHMNWRAYTAAVALWRRFTQARLLDLRFGTCGRKYFEVQRQHHSMQLWRCMVEQTRSQLAMYQARVRVGVESPVDRG